MKNILVLSILIAFFGNCQNNTTSQGVLVTNPSELNDAIADAQPGTEIIMSNGDWNDVKIRLVGYGKKDQPITLRAESPGKVKIQGESNLNLGGEYLVVSGLTFTNGFSPSQSVIQFALNDDTLANHSRVTNCVITDFNKAQRNMTDLWVQFKGRYNQLDHCYIAGKSNRGPTVRVDLAGNESIKNYHQIINNHFGPRPPKGGPSAETIQIGNSYTSMSPSYTQVANNFFERCNGEVEIISSKTNFNEFRNNVFYKSEGSLVTRHGNYCTIDGNYFIGDDDSEQYGGIRLIGTGHWVTNNYFYKLKGQVFRSPLAVMNGIPKSPLNRYIQVTDVVVAHNSWINCTSPLQFGVGSNVDQKDVLPASEIRSARPIRTLVANNLIYNENGDKQPVVAHDLLKGINFQSNIIHNSGVAFESLKGLQSKDFTLNELEENVFIPKSDLTDVELHNGFEFSQITNDLFGNARSKSNLVGATNGSSETKPDLMNLKKFGPDWFNSKNTAEEPKIHAVSGKNDLIKIIEKAKNGDIIELASEKFEINMPLKINKSLTIRSADSSDKATINYTGAAATPVFEMNPKAQLTLQGIKLRGGNTQYAFASLKNNMSSLYNLTVVDSDISNFDYVVKAYKYSFSEYIKFEGSSLSNCANGLELAAEDDDRGDYNAENIFIDKCTFEGIDKNVLDYYRGGYDESTVGGNLIVTNSSFTQCGAKEENGILLNTYGIINVDISGNTFTNNKVKAVAQLWGAKNNSHANNTIKNSGKIIVEENLTMKLMY